MRLHGGVRAGRRTAGAHTGAGMVDFGEEEEGEKPKRAGKDVAASQAARTCGESLGVENHG